MSGTLPTSPAFSSLIVQCVQPTFVSRAISGRRQARQTHGQYFKMTATYPPMTRAQFAPIQAFIAKQRGQYESFQVIPPVINTGTFETQASQGNTSGAWQALETRTNADIQYSTSGDGTGAKFSYTTDNASPPVLTITAIPTAGSGYAVSDTIIIMDDGFSTNRATLTVSAIDGSGGVTAVSDTTPTTYYTAPKVKGASQTGRSIITDSWVLNSSSGAGSNALKAGDYLKFANHDKVYTVTADATSSNKTTNNIDGGIATINIEPALITSPADQSLLTFTSVPFTVALTTRVQEFATGTTGLFEYEIDFEEVI